MMKLLGVIILISLLSVSAYAAKYAGEPFSLGVGARALAMGGSTIAGPFDASAGYWNPAGMNYLTGKNMVAMHSETFGSLLNHDFLGFSIRRDSSATIRAFGFYFYYLGGGGIKITDLDPATGRPYVLREESHGDFLLAGALSGKLGDRVDLGVTARIIYRDIATRSGYGLTMDAGALYQVNRYARLGLVVTDLTSGFIRFSNGTTESILPTVKPGLLLSHTLSDFTGRLAASADIRFEGRKFAAQYWSGDISIDTHYGLELAYKEMIFGRLGFDIGDFTGGVGINIKRIIVDLAYLHHSDLDDTFRISAGYSF
jgi:hypothetical protein